MNYERKRIMRLIKTIIDSEIAYLTVHEKRTSLVSQLKGRNVQFKDTKAFLYKEARREGYYSDESHLKVAKAEKKAWLIYLERFITYVNKNYSDNWIPRTKEAGKTKETPVTVKTAPTVSRVVTPEKITKMLELPENKKAMEEALLDKGFKIVEIDDPFILESSEQAVEFLTSDDETLAMIILGLEAMGYSVGTRLAVAA